MDITVTINSCEDCRHKSHSGAFTPGGAVPVCHLGPVNVPCIDRETREILETTCNDISHWWCRKLNTDLSIPKWCALVHGASY